MPQSLLDMFQPQNAAGEPTSLGDAFTSRSNSLIGLGLGLLAPSNPLRGQSSWGQALEGFQGGAQIDARTAAEAARLRHQKTQDARQAAQDAFQRSQAAQAQANFERTFARSDPANVPTEFTRAARDLGLTPGTPEHAQFAKQFYSTKSEGNLAAQAEQRQTIAKSLGMDPADPKTRAWIASGGALIDETKPPAGYEWGPTQDGRRTQVPIEGGPATKLSDAAAAHLAMLQAAKPGLEEAKKYFLDPAPLLLREGGDQPGGSLYSAGKQVIGEATGSFEIGRQRRNVRLAVEAALRAATGAAAPDKEVDRYTDMYAPGIRDSYETRKQKIEALDRFITTYEGIATRGHGTVKQQTPAASSGGIRKYNPETGKIE
jgi:hypothetical protein